METIRSKIEINLSKHNDNDKQIEGITLILQEIAQGRQLNEFFDLLIVHCLSPKDRPQLLKILAYKAIRQAQYSDNIDYKTQWMKLIPIMERDLQGNEPLVCKSALELLVQTPKPILNYILTKLLITLYGLLQKITHLTLVKCLIDTLSRLCIMYAGEIDVLTEENVNAIFLLLITLCLDYQDQISLSAFSAFRMFFLQLKHNWTFHILDPLIEEENELENVIKIENKNENEKDQKSMKKNKKNENDKKTNEEKNENNKQSKNKKLNKKRILLRCAIFLSKELLKNFDNLLERFSCLEITKSYVCLLPLAVTATQEFIPSKYRKNKAKQLIKTNIRKLAEKHLFPILYSLSDSIVYESCSLILYLSENHYSSLIRDWIYDAVFKLCDLIDRDTDRLNLNRLSHSIIKSIPLITASKQHQIINRIIPYIQLLKGRKERFESLLNIIHEMVEKTLYRYQILGLDQSEKIITPIKKFFESKYIISLCQSQDNLFLDELIYCLCNDVLSLFEKNKFTKLITKNEIKKQRNLNEIEEIKLTNDDNANEVSLLDLNMGTEINLMEEISDQNKEEEEKQNIKNELRLSLDVITSCLKSEIWKCNQQSSSSDLFLRLCDKTFFFIKEFNNNNNLKIEVQHIIGEMLKLYAENKIWKNKIVYLFIICKYININDSKNNTSNDFLNENLNQNENGQNNKQKNKDQKIAEIIFELVKNIFFLEERHSKRKSILNNISISGNFGKLYFKKISDDILSDSLILDEWVKIEKMDELKNLKLNYEKKINQKKKKKKRTLLKKFRTNKQSKSSSIALNINLKDLDEIGEPDFYLIFQSFYILAIRFPFLKNSIIATLDIFLEEHNDVENPLIENCNLIKTKILNINQFNMNLKWFLSLYFLTPSEERPSFLDSEFRRLYQEYQNKKILNQNIKIMNTSSEKSNIVFNFNNNENDDESENGVLLSNDNNNNNNNNNHLKSNKNLKNENVIFSSKSNKKIITGFSNLIRIQAYHVLDYQNFRMDWNLEIINISNVPLNNIHLKINYFGKLYPLKGEKYLINNIINLGKNEIAKWSVPFVISQLTDNSLNIDIHFNNPMQSNTLSNINQILASNRYFLPTEHFLYPMKIPFSFFMNLWNNLTNSIIIDTLLIQNTTSIQNLISAFKSKPLALISENYYTDPEFFYLTFLANTWFDSKIAFVINGIKEVSINNYIVKITIRSESSDTLYSFNKNKNYWIQYLSNNLLEIQKFY
ncbi:tset complex member tsta [Anaeramoeba flamelloides]|uniref:Tset complex member tsta n=1 Tax=Anaeramoeba flamelloides TaxID=1746091 RepID=A0AAV8A479_9EUKA|nr:tset complex member tsta [Anaeramoeba flamelloides]